MITGSVNTRLEAKIRLAIIGPTGIQHDVDAVLDTGFTGSLVLPAAIVNSLGLIRRSGGTAVLADESSCNYDNFGAEILWDGIPRGVVVSAVGREVLAGMMLLSGHRLSIEVTPGGVVSVEPMGS